MWYLNNLEIIFKAVRMKLFIVSTLAFWLLLAHLNNEVSAVDPHEHNKVVCYWNSTSFERHGKCFKLSN